MRDVAEDRPELVTTKDLGLELPLQACTWGWRHPTVASFCHPVTISFLRDLCPLRHLWDSITPACIVGMSGPPCVESVCLRLMGRGLTVTWLTFTLTLIDRFTWCEAFVHYGRGLWDPWIQVVKKGEGLDDWFTSPGYVTFHEMSTACLKMYVGA